MNPRIGIDLGGTKIEGVLLDARGEVIARRRIPTPVHEYGGTVDAICRLVRSLDASVPSGESSLQPPVGIGTPGVWVPRRGAMKNCNSVWLNGQPLKLDIENALGRQIQIANDADCFALAEAHAGAGRGYSTVFGVILGTGVGGGFVMDGKLLRGASGLAGEWGHTPVPYLRSDMAIPQISGRLESRLRDRACYCGRANCIETFLSGPGLEQTHAALHGQTARPEDIGAGEDDPSRETLALYCAMLSRSLAQIVNIVDPDCIVLGGGVSNISRLAERTSELLRAYVFSYECETKIVQAALGDSAGVIGAAWLN